MNTVKGVCYICPTPIGNLKDITLRTLEALEHVDLVACEDTRRTIKLLNAYQIKKPMFLLNEHNKREAQTKLLGELLNGKSIAVVSDAGMPGIADTGSELISLCIEHEVKVEVLPGPVSLINALVASGFSCQQFLFINYFPRKQGKLQQLLERLKKEAYTVCAFEAPHRLLDTLDSLRTFDPSMDICICREMTKIHEEIVRGNIEMMYNIFKNRKILGEITLVIRWTNIEGEK